ncbi:Uncharacterised protein [Mycobacteroides abscessus subsp. abscessus]|nr:Uncharacterised protein [Mycobacteroides abscessus subsp. abscessus]
MTAALPSSLTVSRLVSTWFDSTWNDCGAVTLKTNFALRSGWSKFAKTRRASVGSNCE